MSNAAYELERYYKRRAIGIERLGSKCVECGTTEELEFDHIDETTKLFNVGANWSINLEEWLAEIDKCQLLCKTHHKIKTSQKLTHNRWRYLRYRCRCAECKADYKIYRRIRYLKSKV